MSALGLSSVRGGSIREGFGPGRFCPRGFRPPFLDDGADSKRECLRVWTTRSAKRIDYSDMKYTWQADTFALLLRTDKKIKVKVAEYNIRTAAVRCINISQRQQYALCASSHRFQDISILHLVPLNSRSRSQNITFAMVPLDSNYRKIQVVFCIFALALIVSVHKRLFYIFVFLNKPPATGELLQFSLKPNFDLHILATSFM